MLAALRPDGFEDDAPAGQVGPPTRTERRIAACRAMIEERRYIGKLLGYRLCAAPVWDMLLDLYLAEQEGRPSYLWALSVAAHVPVSTAHRKLQEMTAAGLIERMIDARDRRRVAVTLSAGCAARLDRLMDARADAAGQ